jgi:hypothetical protein
MAVVLSIITPAILQAVLFLTWSRRAFPYHGPVFVPFVQLALTLLIGFLIVARAWPKRLIEVGILYFPLMMLATVSWMLWFSWSVLGEHMQL